MDSIQNEVKQFRLRKLKMAKIKSDIFFLSQCKKLNVLPKFTTIKSKTKSANGILAINKARRLWLINELKRVYGKLSSLEAQTYHLHQSLLQKLSFCEMEAILECILPLMHNSQRNNFHIKREKLNGVMV